MNLKIENNGLRFRITESELQTLLTGQALEEITDITGKKLIVMIDPVSSNSEMEAAMMNNTDDTFIRMTISPEQLQMLEQKGRSKEGLESRRNELTISLQVDVRSQKRQAA